VISLARRIMSARSLILLAFLVALLVRILLAPISAFDDVGSFHYHAVLLLEHGFDFYLHAGETGQVAGAYVWAYAYPPVWAMILAIAYSGSAPFVTMLDYAFDPAWRVAEKLPIIIADMMVGYVLFKWFGERKGLRVASLWLFNFMVIFISSIFGQFDSVATLFLLLSLYCISRSEIACAGVFGGLALMTKQHVLFGLLPLFVWLLRNDRLGARRFLQTLIETVVILNLPFIMSYQAFKNYFELVWVGPFLGFSSGVIYQQQRTWESFLALSISNDVAGIYQASALISSMAGVEVSSFLRAISLLSILLISVSLLLFCVLTTKEGDDPNHAVLAGLISFLAFSVTVHPQYTVVLPPFILIDVYTRGRKPWTAIIPFILSLWPIMAPPYGLMYFFFSFQPIDLNIARVLKPILEPIAFFLSTPFSGTDLPARFVLSPILNFSFSVSLLVYLTLFLVRDKNDILQGSARIE